MSILSHVHAQFTVYFCSCRFAFKIPPRKVYKRVRQLPEESESAVESSSTSVVVMNVKKLKDGTRKYHQKRNDCLFCDKCYPKKFMWKHMKRCALSQKCGKAKPGKTRVQSLCAFAQPVPAGDNQNMENDK